MDSGFVDSWIRGFVDSGFVDSSPPAVALCEGGGFVSARRSFMRRRGIRGAVHAQCTYGLLCYPGRHQYLIQELLQLVHLVLSQALSGFG